MLFPLPWPNAFYKRLIGIEILSLFSNSGFNVAEYGQITIVMGYAVL